MDMRFEMPVAKLDEVRVGLRSRHFDAHAGEPTVDGVGVLVVRDADDPAAVQAAVDELLPESSTD